MYFLSPLVTQLLRMSLIGQHLPENNYINVCRRNKYFEKCCIPCLKMKNFQYTLFCACYDSGHD